MRNEIKLLLVCSCLINIRQLHTPARLENSLILFYSSGSDEVCGMKWTTLMELRDFYVGGFAVVVESGLLHWNGFNNWFFHSTWTMMRKSNFKRCCQSRFTRDKSKSLPIPPKSVTTHKNLNWNRLAYKKLKKFYHPVFFPFT